MTDKTEAQSIIDAAVAAAEPTRLPAGEFFHVIVPAKASREEIDTEFLLEEPRRHRGMTAHHQDDSFSRFVARYQQSPTLLYADVDAFKVTAVFNDSSSDVAGWSDHRAVLTLRKTPQWLLWEKHDGELLGQVQFAEHLEDGALEIVNPDAATLLELAQTFHAHTGVQFKSSQMLASGERKLQYEETTTAIAGTKGDIQVPKEFELGLEPFEGAPSYKLTARLRFRINNGQLAIGYRLDRPNDVLRSAFADVVERIGGATAIDPFFGTPPVGMGGGD